MQILRIQILTFILLTAFIFPSQLSAKSKHSYQYDLAIAAIFQDEAPYLREWIEFHKLTGVQHFYLYNNLSTDHYLEVLQPYMNSGEVELIDWNVQTTELKSFCKIQCAAYNHAVELAKDSAQWLAVLDIDEFLFPVQTDSLIDFLQDYADFGGVCANWQMFGTSGVFAIPTDKFLIETLLYKAPIDYQENVHVKSIVQPNKVKRFKNPHFCEYKYGHYQVTPDKIPFNGPFSIIAIDKLRINHYWSRDEFFLYTKKMPRRNKWNDNNQNILQRVANINVELDSTILKYLPKLRQSISLIED